MADPLRDWEDWQLAQELRFRLRFEHAGTMELAALRDGEPCSHPGCLSHVTHPCDGCGRVGGRSVMESNQTQAPITECPCCGWTGYVTTPRDEDEAVLSCEWCTKNMDGEPRLCAMAESIYAKQGLSGTPINKEPFKPGPWVCQSFKYIQPDEDGK